MSTHTITFAFERWVGWDFWRAFLPARWQARTIAKALIRVCRMCKRYPAAQCPLRAPGATPNVRRCGPYRGVDLNETVLLIGGSLGSYRVMDGAGTVKEWARDDLPSLGGL